MLNKSDIIHEILLETKIIKHLATKIPEGGLEYRPTPKQRSTLELLQYLSFIGLGYIQALKDGNPNGMGPLSEKAKEIGLHNFAQAMDHQAHEIKTALHNMSDEFLDQELLLFGLPSPSTKGGRVFFMLKNFIAYRMQLFLYIKAAGNDKIGTPDCWMGEDAPSTST